MIKQDFLKIVNGSGVWGGGVQNKIDDKVLSCCTAYVPNLMLIFLRLTHEYHYFMHLFRTYYSYLVHTNIEEL